MAKVQHSRLDPGRSASADLMTDAASSHLYVNLSASAVRRRLKGHGFGVRRIEAAGKGRTVIVHTATVLEMWEGRQSLGFTDPPGLRDVPPRASH